MKLFFSYSRPARPPHNDSRKAARCLLARAYEAGAAALRLGRRGQDIGASVHCRQGVRGAKVRERRVHLLHLLGQLQDLGGHRCVLIVLVEPAEAKHR